jgi:hypothetical protein
MCTKERALEKVVEDLPGSGGWHELVTPGMEIFKRAGGSTKSTSFTQKIAQNFKMMLNII